MVLNKSLAVAIGAAMLAATGAACADEYRPDEFLSLDLTKAVFSPKPLGPPSRFQPVPVQARTDVQAKAIRTEPVHVDPVPRHAAAMRKAATRTKVVVHAPVAKRPAPAVVAKRPVPAPTRMARHHGNPLDANALDTRIQVWPCRSGGICNWQRAAPQ